MLCICCWLMGGLAMLALELFLEVSCSDAYVFPEMSKLLEKKGIDLIQGNEESQLDPVTDMVNICHSLTRGNPSEEAVLDRKIPYLSG
ncbi:UDP-N-acetylmuramate:L-alanyl-gamma-D-glutamyl-meso-diaminopimelate ligase, partial [Erwinia amylovora]|nr:UDP-N-acetylmuramate:L-alanyl-gamma-D-glutamyl-meso-diaminopimelate ligase [Erwinia amylovora]